MYTLNNTLADQKYDKLQIKPLIRSECCEVLAITLEKGCAFPEHVSPKDAHVLVLEGAIDFYINSEIFHLQAYQILDFEAQTKHFVKAQQNSRFLIIR